MGACETMGNAMRTQSLKVRIFGDMSLHHSRSRYFAMRKICAFSHS
jgi:hypothetical protein